MIHTDKGSLCQLKNFVQMFDTRPDCPERLPDVPREHRDHRRLGFEGNFSETHPALPEDLVVVVRELWLVDSPGCYAQEVPLSQVFGATLHRPRSDPEKLQDGSQARDFEHEVIGHWNQIVSSLAFKITFGPFFSLIISSYV